MTDQEARALSDGTVWAMKAPDGSLRGYTARQLRTDAWHRVELLPHYPRRRLYQLGWRCVKCKLVEVGPDIARAV